jgi:hypothetical protein
VYPPVTPSHSGFGMLWAAGCTVLLDTTGQYPKLTNQFGTNMNKHLVSLSMKFSASLPYVPKKMQLIMEPEKRWSCQKDFSFWIFAGFHVSFGGCNLGGGWASLFGTLYQVYQTLQD